MSPLSEDYREISSAVNIYLNWQDYVVVTSGSMLVERNVTEREVSVWYKEIWRSQHRPERLSVISGTDWPDWCFLSSSRHPDLGSQQEREPDKKVEDNQTFLQNKKVKVFFSSLRPSLAPSLLSVTESHPVNKIQSRQSPSWVSRRQSFCFNASTDSIFIMTKPGAGLYLEFLYHYCREASKAPGLMPEIGRYAETR